MASGSPTQRAIRSVGRPLVAAVAIGTVTFAAVPSAGAAPSPISTAALTTSTPASTTYRPLHASSPAVAEPVPAGTVAVAPAPVAALPMPTTTAEPGTAAAVAIAFALAQRGLPYVWGGDGPGAGEAGFDCSGLTTAAYAAAGIALPRTAHTQFYAGPHVPDGAVLDPGDLVFYGIPARVHHVGLYLGNGLMVNAPTFGEPVQIAYVRYAGDDYLGATRPAAGLDTPGLLTTPDLPYTVPAVPRPDVPKAPTAFPAPAAPVPAPVTTSPAAAEHVLAAAQGVATTGPVATPSASGASSTAPGGPTSPATSPSPPAGPGTAVAGRTTPDGGPPAAAPPAAAPPAAAPVVSPPVAAPPGTSPPGSTTPSGPAPAAARPGPATPPSASPSPPAPPSPTVTTPTVTSHAVATPAAAATPAAPARLLLPATGTTLTLVVAGRDPNGLPVAPTAPANGSLTWRPGTGGAWVAAIGLPAGLPAPAVGGTLVLIGSDGTRTTLTVRSRATTDPAAAKVAATTAGTGPRAVLLRTDPATGQVLVIVAS